MVCFLASSLPLRSNEDESGGGLIANFVVLKPVLTMNIGEQIKRIRAAKGLSQKEVIISAGLDKAQYSRIENSKTDPYFSTVERIAKAMGISLSDLFTTSGEPKEIQSHDKSIMEKVNMIESLAEEEKATIYKMLDAFLGKKKLKDALASVLKDVE